jgi:hypothetical protein
MAQRFYEPVARIFTNAGAVGVGYKYYFYQTGTTTPVTTYQNIGLTVANTNPVLSDANGRFPEIWYSDLSQLKLIVKDSSNNTIETVDPVGATDAAVSLNDFDVRPTSYWGLTAGTSTAFTLIANPTISAYANTQTFVVQVHVDCGDAPTLAIDGLSALNWKKYTQQGTKVVMKANDLRASQRYFCINDGVDVVCLNPNSLPMLSGTATSLTVAAGVITLTNNSSSYVLNTEGAAATDDLDTINGGQDGQIIICSLVNASRVVTFKDGTGNLALNNNLNFSPNSLENSIVLRYDSTSATWKELCRNGGAGTALITYQVTAGTAGGGSTSGSWQTRALNTEVFDTNNIVSLSGNVMTLAAGTYEISAMQVFWCGSNTQKSCAGRIYNTADGATVAVGLSVRSDVAAGGTQLIAHIPPTVFTITANKTFALNYYTELSQATDGLGKAFNTGEVERYASVFIKKY